MKKRRISKFSFSKQETRNATLNMNYAGISLPNATVEALDGRNYDLHKPLEQFGIFGGSQAETAHPGMTRDELLVKEEDFVKQKFRLISAGIVASGTWRATDFSKPGVLKSSMPKILGKGVYKNHDTDVDDWVGLVEAVSWSEGYDDPRGKVPGGIDGLLAIDGKTNYKVARGVQIKALYSNSVTVEFEWEPSHSLSSEENFEDLIGTIHEDGREITRVVTKIIDYYETSLVWLGADPFAKMVGNDGKLLHPDNKAFSQEQEVAFKKQYSDNKKYSISFALSKNILSLSTKNSKFERSPKNDTPMKKEILEALIAKLGLSKVEEITTDFIENLTLRAEGEEPITAEQKLQLQALEGLTSLEVVTVNEEGEESKSALELIKDGKVTLAENFSTENVVIAASTLENLNNQVSTLKEEKTNLETEKENLTADAEMGKAYLKNMREEAVRLYKLNVENADEAVIALFNKATSKEIKGLLEQYTKGATAKFKGTCKDCGSENFQFRSTHTGEPTGGEHKEPVKNFDFFHKKFDKQSLLG